MGHTAYEQSLFERADLSFNDLQHDYLSLDALQAPLNPRSADSRLSLLDEGFSRSFLAKSTEAARRAIQRGVRDVLASDLASELRAKYDVLSGAPTFIDIWPPGVGRSP
jgi:hypothetical protein